MKQGRGIAYGGQTPLVFACLLVFGVGCSASPERGPIEDSTMVQVLIELHLAVARAEVTNEIPPALTDSILTAYAVDSTTYAEAVAFYAERPAMYEELYSRMLDRLNRDRLPLEYASENEAAPSPAPPARPAR